MDPDSLTLRTWPSSKLTGSNSHAGQRSLHLRGDALDILVLVNPSDKSLCDEVGTRQLLGAWAVGLTPSPILTPCP